MHGYQAGKGRGGMDWEIGIGVHTLLCRKCITKENLLYNIGNFTQCSVGKKSRKREYVYTYG